MDTLDMEPAKDRENRRKHDPHALSQPDPFPHEERWQTVGAIGQTTIFVVHTWPESSNEIGRIISARKATSHERKAYEEGEF